MVGEIRDHETAEMAIQSALTGHLVFSTLHTNVASSAVTRLVDLGIEPYLISSSAGRDGPAAGAKGVKRVPVAASAIDP
jgi:type II secretory ATPase GspE/PulE/Tfp pilus assembly ATPase PilB-like protein